MGQYERLYDAFANREQVAEELTPDEMSSLMRQIVIPTEQSLKSFIRSSQALIWLDQHKDRLTKTLGESPSPRRLTLEFVEHRLLGPLVPRTDGGAWFDLTHGVIATIGSVRLAEDSKREEAEPRVTKHVVNLQDHFQGNLTMANQSEIYLRMQKWVSEATALLEEDPSGIKLVEDSVNKLKKQENVEGTISQIHPFQYPELVIKGAEWALEAYKNIYPKAERLTRPK